MPSFAVELTGRQIELLKEYWDIQTDAELRNELQRVIDDEIYIALEVK